MTINAEQAFNIMYGALAESDHTLACSHCGTTLLGDSPAFPITCVDCLKNFNIGAIMEDRTICFECAVLEDPRFDRATPITHHTHPDGFTCDICGDVYTDLQKGN